MIRMISGATRIGDKTYRPSDGAFSVDEDIEKRLVAAGVAVVAEGTALTDVATGSKAEDDNGAGNNMSDSENGTETTEDGSSGDTLDVVDGHFDRESLLKMKREDMEHFAADLGIDEQTIRGCKNKGELADVIAAVEVEAPSQEDNDGGTPPQLGAGDVVQ